jgi:hypothetical protein
MTDGLDGEDFACLDGEDLACLGMRRDSDFFAQIRREGQAELMRALGAPNGFKPTADPPKPRRQRKPSVRSFIKQAEKAGKPVTSITLPDGTVLHFGKGEDTEASNPWLADLTKVKQ